MAQTSARRAIVTVIGVWALVVVAACDSSPQAPTAARTTASPATETTATAVSPEPTTTATTATTAPTATPAQPTPTTPVASKATSIPLSLASLTGQVVTRIPTSRKVVALTFDAGANGDGVPSILATLSREKVAATFFLTGNFVDRYPGLSRRMAAAGPLGNHTVDHPHLPTLTSARVATEVVGTRGTFLRITGEDPRPLFRFPFGDSTSSEVRLVNSLGYVAVGWTVDTIGWQGTSGGRSVDSVVHRVLAAAVPGEIVLMHVGSHPTDHSTLDADSLPRIISGLRAAGYGFVNLDSLRAG